MEFSNIYLIYFILAMPVIFSAVAATNVLSLALLHWADRITATAVFAAVIMLLSQFDTDAPIHYGYIYVDALSLWMLLIT